MKNWAGCLGIVFRIRWTQPFLFRKDGRPDTYVITGDIDAMWLRDSSAQVYPYLDFMSEDKNLQRLIIGVINKQTSFILKDPYANAFYDDDTKYTRWNSDHTEMKPGIHERKYELDSLCYPIRLAYGYWKRQMMLLLSMRNGRRR